MSKPAFFPFSFFFFLIPNVFARDIEKFTTIFPRRVKTLAFLENIFIFEMCIFTKKKEATSRKHMLETTCMFEMIFVLSACHVFRPQRSRKTHEKRVHLVGIFRIGLQNCQRAHSDLKSGAPKRHITSFGRSQRAGACGPPCIENSSLRFPRRVTLVFLPET